MNSTEWEDQIRAAGYRVRCQEQAYTDMDREAKAFPSINILMIYGPDGDWLGRVITQEAREVGGKIPCGVFVFYETEDNRLEADLTELKRRADTAAAQREARG